MLEASGEVVYVNEPMSLSRPPGGSPGVLNARVEHRFQYVDPDDDAIWRSAFADTTTLRFHPLAELRAVRHPYHLARGIKYGVGFTLGARRGRRAMLDDPNAVFSARWLTERIGVRTVVVVRDPVGLIGSWRQLGWRPHLDALLAQPALIRDHLGEDVDRIRSAVESGDWLTQMCCLWNVGHRVIDEFRELDDITVWRYEDLASDPLGQFEQLYDWFGLTWSERARSTIDDATSASDDRHRGFAWNGWSRTAFRRMDSKASVGRVDRRLNPDEADRVRAATADLLDRFPRRVADTPSD